MKAKGMAGKFTLVILALFSVFVIFSGVYGCESCQRKMKSIQSSTMGLKRKVVWTGHDGSRKVWTGNFKIDSNQGSPTVYFISDGKTVIVGPGYYSVEVD